MQKSPLKMDGASIPPGIIRKKLNCLSFALLNWSQRFQTGPATQP
jgi:hypothetical protein